MGLVEGSTQTEQNNNTINQDEKEHQHRVLVVKIESIKSLIRKYEPKVIRWKDEVEHLRKQL